MKHLTLLRAITLVCAVGAASPAAAQEKSGMKEGFSLKPGTVRIVLMRPHIRVGAQTTGGDFQPNADWTAQSRDYLGQALAQAQSDLGNSVETYVEEVGEDGPLVSQYAKLVGSVADSVITYQFFPGNRLPTKKHSKSFEWGVGSGLAKLRSLQGADYALFISTLDEYGSTGRKLLQIAGMLGGIGITSGVHMGNAGLVDLKSGELVWLNADRQMGGDVRTSDGARKRAKELLKGFPGKAVAPSGVQ